MVERSAVEGTTTSGDDVDSAEAEFLPQLHPQHIISMNSKSDIDHIQQQEYVYRHEVINLNYGI